MKNLSEIMDVIHEDARANAVDASLYLRAAVTCSLTLGPGGATLEGWITYNDETYGKIYFKSSKITEHSGAAALLGALPEVRVLAPEKIDTHGTFAASGGGFVAVGGSLMLYNASGTNIFKEAFAIAGSGTPYFSVHGDDNYEKTK